MLAHEAAVSIQTSAIVGAPRAAEATEIHTRILRLALGIEEARGYWEHVDPGVVGVARANAAFEQRWFGAKSMERVRYLLAVFHDRFDAFPSALMALRHWRAMDLPTRQVVCHWHAQMSDPIYRRFTGDFLVQRRALRDPKIDRGVVLRWVRTEFPDRWAEATCVQFASKLLSAASEAGLVTEKRDPRDLLYPKVPDLALAFLLYLLREVHFEGSLTQNPYLASVGLEGELLEARLRSLPGVTYRRMMHLVEFEWASPDLASWAAENL